MRSDEQTAPVQGVPEAAAPHPFKLQRLGHFGFLVEDPRASLRFYEELLGLMRSDVLDFAADFGIAVPDGHERHGFFLRFGGDHHAFVLFPRWAFEAARIPKAPGTWPIAHAAWQVGSPQEIVDGMAWIKARGRRLTRPPGRDLPGGNWTFTMAGADGISHEIYYGMDQIGWDGISRPSSMFALAQRQLPERGEPMEPESAVIARSIRGGVDLAAGLQDSVGMPGLHDVGGLRLPRPFIIDGHGPLRLFTEDIDAALRYYTEDLGLVVTEEVAWRGHRAAFLRAGSEHHSIALYDMPLRSALGGRQDSLCLSFGMRIGTYRQLREAMRFLEGRGVALKEIPPALTPGIAYSVLAFDPDGNAIELYCEMDTIGWDGRVRPPATGALAERRVWPEAG